VTEGVAPAEERPSPRRSTSMPTQPELEPLPPTGAPLERQLLDLLFDRAPFGLALFDLEGRLERCNRTWSGYFELYFGAGPDYTVPGTPITDLIPGNEAALAELFDAVRSGHAVRQAAHRIAIPGVETYWDVLFAPVYDDGRPVGVLDVVTDATDRVLSSERLQARVRAFTSVAASMTVDQPLLQTLDGVREQLLATTSATACSVVTWLVGPESSTDWFTMAADPAFGPGYADAVKAMHLADDRDQSELARRPIAHVPSARTRLLLDARFAPVAPYWSAPRPEWDDLVVVPLVAGAVAYGELHLHLPEGARITADDHDYLRAMGDQAALAVQNRWLFDEQASAAGLAERQRLARDLHDSVSQALFSMTMHARAAERRLADLGPEADPAREELALLHELTRGALAEMRALIFELRPQSLAEEGLVAALRRQGAAVSAREQVVVEVRGPQARLPLGPAAEEHLYRIALEAVHNAVKHGHPTRVVVDLAVVDGTVRLEVDDDGMGFDTAQSRPGHLGLGTMSERAGSLGGALVVTSRPGTGTTVVATVPAVR
jgi:signal transduction histidine kinase